VEPTDQPELLAAFGEAVVVSPDVSGDGVPDILVSAPSATSRNQPDAAGGNLLTGALAGVLDLVARVVSPATVGVGRVHFLSGADGAIVRSIADPAPDLGDGFGGAVAPIGDQDGDGVVDHLVADGGANQLHLYSGSDGRLVRSLLLPAAVQGRGGIALAQAGDMDGDGRNDAWLGIRSARTVYLMNGTGAVLASSPSPSPQGAFGAAVAAAGSMSGAGADLVVGDPAEPGGGAAYLLQKGPDALLVAETRPDHPGECVGLACANLLRLQAEVQAQAPISTTTTTTTTTTVTPTTTTVPTTIATNATGPSATLPKPASVTTTESALPDTGGTDRSLAGLLALVVGMAGVTRLRRRRERAPGGAPPSAG
jgi:hypothetical protein